MTARLVSCGLLVAVVACGGRRAAPAPPTEVPRAQRVIAFGQNLTGQLQPLDAKLPDNFLYQQFVFVARNGQSVTIDAMSGEFDPYLMVRDTFGTRLAADDDTGEGRNARLVFTFPYAGPFHILVGTYAGGRGGAFSLSVR